MAALPDLPEPKRRKLDVLWADLVEQHHFTGDHLQWWDSPEKRREAAKPKYEVHPSPPIVITDPRPPTRVEYVGAKGEPISYQEAVELRKAWWAARENDPEVIDSIGVRESSLLGEVVFFEVAELYFQSWSEQVNARYDDFRDWLEGICVAIEHRIATLWNSRGEWYTRVCSATLRDALSSLIKEWRDKARKFEMNLLDQEAAGLAITRKFDEMLSRYSETLARTQPPPGPLEVQPPQPAETSLAESQHEFYEEIQRQIVEAGTRRSTKDTVVDQIRSINGEGSAHEAGNKSVAAEVESKSTERAVESSTKPKLEAQVIKQALRTSTPALDVVLTDPAAERTAGTTEEQREHAPPDGSEIEPSPMRSVEGSEPKAESVSRRGRPQGIRIDGDKLRRLRRDCELSQEEFAQECRVSLATIQRGEAGDRWNSETLANVSATLSSLIKREVSPEDLKK